MNQKNDCPYTVKYHPLLRKQIHFATIDCESENKDNY